MFRSTWAMRSVTITCYIFLNYVQQDHNFHVNNIKDEEKAGESNGQNIL